MGQANLEDLISLINSRRAYATDFLRGLVNFDSTFIDHGVRGNELPIQRWLEDKLSEWGYETRLFEPDNEKIKDYPDFNPGRDYTDRPNLVAILKGDGSGRSLILNGHVDTVPLGDRDQWTHDPLAGEIEDGKMYGRGTCDMKAGLAAMILAVEFLREAGFKLEGDIVIESVVDEEGGGNGTLACVAEGYRADAAIVTEPTSLHIRPCSRGVLLLNVDVEGKSTHAALKWRGVSAIEKAIKIVEGMGELEREWLAKRNNPLLPAPTITIGRIDGGLAAATVPGECNLKFDVKYLPIEVDGDGNERAITGDEIQREVEEWIGLICAGDDWLRAHPPELDWYVHVLPYWLDPDHPLVDTLRSSCAKVLGRSFVSGMPSGADARILHNAGNISTVLFGPGNLEQAHSTDEYVPLDQYMDAIKVLAIAILNWTSRLDGEPVS
jgi:acetylornithine deacetylase